MDTVKADKVQELMNRAYDRWRNNHEENWTLQQFWNQLDANERFAVFVGNFNYQVENGGFIQWWDNQYATDETISYLLVACKSLGTKASDEVEQLIRKFVTGIEEFKATEDSDYGSPDEAWMELHSLSDQLSDQYYKINKQFMQDCEEFLQKKLLKEAKPDIGYLQDGSSFYLHRQGDRFEKPFMVVTVPVTVKDGDVAAAQQARAYFINEFLGMTDLKILPL